MSALAVLCSGLGATLALPVVAQTPSKSLTAEESFQVGMVGIRDPFVLTRELGGWVDLVVRFGPLVGPARHETLRFLLDEPIYERTLGRENWTSCVSTLVVDGTTLDATGLRDHLQGSNPYAIVAACRAVVARHEAFADQDQWIIGLLRHFLMRPWEEPHANWKIEARELEKTIDADTVRWMHTHASLALAKFRPDDPLTVLGYCQQLYDVDVVTRMQAARRLAELRDPDAAEWLLDAAKIGPSEFTVAALAAVERIGPSVRHHARVLATFKEDPDDAVRATAERVYRVLLDDFEIPSIEPSYEMVGNYDPAERGLALDEERDRLVRWLDRDAGANREALLFDPRHIDRYAELTAALGGPLSDRMRWLPVRVQRDGFAPGYWAPTVALPLGGVDAAPHGVIGKERERLRKDPFVIELIPVDREDPRLVHPDSARLSRSGFPPSNAILVRFEPAAVGKLEKMQRGRAQGCFLHVVDGLVIGVEKVNPAWSNVSSNGWMPLRPRNGAAAHLEAIRKLYR